MAAEMRPVLLVVAVTIASFSFVSREAEAQYKSGQLGFEAGYGFYEDDLLVDEHNFMVGLRGAFKAEDHWWFSARGLLSFRGDLDQNSGRTVVILSIVPVAVRYYILTDSIRPFVGITNTFQFFFNTGDGTPIGWGPGGEVGIEIKLVRDIFLGFQADVDYLFVFERADAPIVTVNAQLLFFL
jgi:hypothetical protein